MEINTSLSDSTAQQKSPHEAVTVTTQLDSDARSDTSFDPLFDDDADGEIDDTSQSAANLLTRNGPSSNLAMPSTSQAPTLQVSPISQAAQRSFVPPKNAPPLLDPPGYAIFSPDILMTASIDGQIILWDKRMQGGKEKGGVGRLWMSDKTPPWCLSVSHLLLEAFCHSYRHQACWSADGGQIYAGRRNGTVDVWDVRQLGLSGPASTPRLLKTLRNPLSSGVVSCVVAFPDGKHIAW
jgi:transcriptional activator SPT8